MAFGEARAVLFIEVSTLQGVLINSSSSSRVSPCIVDFIAAVDVYTYSGTSDTLKLSRKCLD